MNSPCFAATTTSKNTNITANCHAEALMADSKSPASIPELVAKVYEGAPAKERAHMLEELLQPIGVISLMGVAGGVFANIRFRSGWQDMRVNLEDIQNVRGNQIAALVSHAEQISAEALDGLAQLLTASPLMSSSAAAALLLTVLLRRASKPSARLTVCPTAAQPKVSAAGHARAPRPAVDVTAHRGSAALVALQLQARRNEARSHLTAP